MKKIAEKEHIILGNVSILTQGFIGIYQEKSSNPSNIAGEKSHRRD